MDNLPRLERERPGGEFNCGWPAAILNSSGQSNDSAFTVAPPFGASDPTPC